MFSERGPATRDSPRVAVTAVNGRDKRQFLPQGDARHPVAAVDGAPRAALASPPLVDAERLPDKPAMPHGEKDAVYRDLARELTALVAGEPDLIANCANMAALLYHRLPDLNWAGFYLARRGELVLGPFQGKPACVRIAWGKGVCGAAAQRRATIVVADVTAFPGHIACDAASRSELVVPLIVADRVVGVLDLDSPLLGRFDAEDRAGCERLVAVLVAHQRDWPADHPAG
jgi:GAF domain-containing protein